jgi:hypothetical protein
VTQGTKRGRDVVSEPVTTLVASENETSRDDISESTPEPVDKEPEAERIREA